MVTIKINEKTKAGKAILEAAESYSDDKENVEIIRNSKSESKEKIPNAETLKAMEDAKNGIGLTKTESHEDLMKKLFS